MAGAIAAHPIAFVLDLAPDLGEGIGADDWERARDACRGQLLSAPRGADEREIAEAARGEPLGFVIVEGLIVREVALRDRHMLELLGPGDVLQLPVLADRPRLGASIRLTAASETVLLALGTSFIRAGAVWPSLLRNIYRLLEVQREQLAIQGVIAHLGRADHRLLLMLWHLSDRWGRVTGQGTVLPLPLTHDLLGQLTAARRSTVTLAFNQLESDGLIRRLDDGSCLLAPAAEQRVRAIASTNTAGPALGQMLALRFRAREVGHGLLAARAEAIQVRRRQSATYGHRAAITSPAGSATPGTVPRVTLPDTKAADISAHAAALARARADARQRAQNARNRPDAIRERAHDRAADVHE